MWIKSSKENKEDSIKIKIRHRKILLQKVKEKDTLQSS